MNQVKIERLKVLQHKLDHAETFTTDEANELEALRMELSVTEREVADDPRTPFKDETERPNLADDGDYGEQEKARDVKAALDFIESLALRIGKEAALLVIDAAVAAIKK